MDEHIFRQHERAGANKSTIEHFIERILTERNQNKYINFDLLQQDERLLGIYNEILDSHFTHQGLLSEFNNDEQEM